MSPDEVAALVRDVRDRVRDRHARQTPEIPDFELPELEPLGRARDLADGKVAAIGHVNPRRPGLVNNLIQWVKKTVARSLNWMVRDQVEFNRAVVAYMDRQIETQVEYNYNLLRVAREVVRSRQELAERLDGVDGAIAEIRDDVAELRQTQTDMLRHWSEWKPAFEEKLTQSEIHFLHAVREIEGELRKREEGFRADWLTLHQNYDESLRNASADIQQRLWADLDRLKAEQERMIQTELRVLRRKAAVEPVAPAAAPAAAVPETSAPRPGPPATAAGLDYTRFEERFRGDEEFVSQNQRFYLPIFEGKTRVLDLGCGRGELLKLLADRGADVGGVDLDPEALAACREKGLPVEQGDLYSYLASQPDSSCDGLFCAHVAEHLPAERLQELADLAFAKLRPGGVFALETPNPGCLAIFAGDFYLDPTHEKPVPAARLHFHLEEAGFVSIETHERHPAVEVFPNELGPLAASEELAAFQKRFFGGLDYAIIGRKP
ncbi:MAG: methyltransferase domain-containing protein [Acidobacteria bacterium]|nr:methyltransferase domain-containing protein [Acidobacteriota bacterium]